MCVYAIDLIPFIYEFFFLQQIQKDKLPWHNNLQIATIIMQKNEKGLYESRQWQNSGARKWSERKKMPNDQFNSYVCVYMKCHPREFQCVYEISFEYLNMPFSHNDGNRKHDCCDRNQLIKFSFRKSHNNNNTNSNSGDMLSGYVQFKHLRSRTQSPFEFSEISRKISAWFILGTVLFLAKQIIGQSKAE